MWNSNFEGFKKGNSGNSWWSCECLSILLPRLRPRNGKTAARGIFSGRMGADEPELLPLSHKNGYSGAESPYSLPMSSAFSTYIVQTASSLNILTLLHPFYRVIPKKPLSEFSDKWDILSNCSCLFQYYRISLW